MLTAEARRSLYSLALLATCFDWRFLSPSAGNLVDFLKAAEGLQLTIYKLLDMAAQV